MYTANDQEITPQSRCIRSRCWSNTYVNRTSTKHTLSIRFENRVSPSRIKLGNVIVLVAIVRKFYEFTNGQWKYGRNNKCLILHRCVISFLNVPILLLSCNAANVFVCAHNSEQRRQRNVAMYVYVD